MDRHREKHRENVLNARQHCRIIWAEEKPDWRLNLSKGHWSFFHAGLVRPLAGWAEKPHWPEFELSRLPDIRWFKFGSSPLRHRQPSVTESTARSRLIEGALCHKFNPTRLFAHDAKRAWSWCWLREPAKKCFAAVIAASLTRCKATKRKPGSRASSAQWGKVALPGGFNLILEVPQLRASFPGRDQYPFNDPIKILLWPMGSLAASSSQDFR
jgi:hypothetical protein